MATPAPPRPPLERLFAGVTTGLLGAGRPVRFRAKGTSMQPAIREGDLLTVEPVEAERVRRGDILLFSDSRGLLAHRVVRLLRSGDGPPAFLLQGDASRGREGPVEGGRVLGRVVRVERDGRVVRLFWGRSSLVALLWRLSVRMLRLGLVVLPVPGKRPAPVLPRAPWWRPAP